jgi:hypothetical protein
LGVDLWSWEGWKVSWAFSIFSWFNESSLNQTGNFLNVCFCINSSFNSSCLNSGLLLNSKYQTYWDESFSKFANDWCILGHVFLWNMKN